MERYTVRYSPNQHNITHHTSHITHHTSRITYHTSRITHHVSPPSECPAGRIRGDLGLSQIIVEFAGAKNPLVYIQNEELHQIKGDVNPIGGSQARRKAGGYQKHTVRIDRPTTLYLFSDGYQDQFGGEENTKFMTKRFKQLLLDIHQQPMEAQRDILNTTIEAWKNGGKQTDDILVMGIRLGA